jgi:hypothetical protein
MLFFRCKPEEPDLDLRVGIAFHVLICAGESWYSKANSASVLRSLSASNTTSVLKVYTSPKLQPR